MNKKKNTGRERTKIFAEQTKNKRKICKKYEKKRTNRERERDRKRKNKTGNTNVYGYWIDEVEIFQFAFSEWAAMFGVYVSVYSRAQNKLFGGIGDGGYERPIQDYGEVCQLEHLGCLNKYFIFRKRKDSNLAQRNEKIKIERKEPTIHTIDANQILHTTHTHIENRANQSIVRDLSRCIVLAAIARNNFKHSAVIFFLFVNVVFSSLSIYRARSYWKFVHRNCCEWLMYMVLWMLPCFDSHLWFLWKKMPIKPLFSRWLDHVLRF